MNLPELFPDYPVTSLYLDDCRTPRPNMYFNWVVVRSYTEFCNYIRQQGLPRFITFDHDLGEEAIRVGAASQWQTFDYAACSEMTGYDAAKWLVEYLLDTDQDLPPFTVHSANPPGAENILAVLRSYQRHRGQEPGGYRTHW